MPELRVSLVLQPVDIDEETAAEAVEEALDRVKAAVNIEEYSYTIVDNIVYLYMRGDELPDD